MAMGKVEFLLGDKLLWKSIELKKVALGKTFILK